MKPAIHFGLLLAALAWLTVEASAAEQLVPTAGPFQPIKADLLDKKTFIQWVDGHESAFDGEKTPIFPTDAVWTTSTQPRFQGVNFGEGRATGPRFMRIGFSQAVPIGSILIRGGAALSVLKSDAAYPGDVTDNAQWIAAERLVDGQVSHAEVGGEGYALWLLPADTQTRAVRLSHSPAPGDREMAGWLGGMWINQEHVVNLAPQALVQSVARDDASAKLVDESNNRQWGAWDNGEQGAAIPISPEHPERITLTWPRQVELTGVCLIWAGFSAVEIDAFAGADQDIIAEAPDSAWQRVASQSDIDPLYPLPLGPHWLPLGKPVTTRALRLRIVGPPNLNHPHLMDKGFAGHRVWLGELMAVGPVKAGTDLAKMVVPRSEVQPPPIPVRFTLPSPGVVTLVIDDEQNHRVRNLVSETPFPAGENVAWWDGSDDLLRDPDAAHHGVYHIPTRPVTPGTYRVSGLWHQPLSLHYEFSIYNAGKPAWETADGTGCWLTTHTPPTSVACVPGSRTRSGEPLVFMGAYVAEGGHGLQWLAEDGTKLGGQGWIGGNWTGAPTLAVDLGSAAVPEHLVYVGSIWEGELRLTAKTQAFTDESVLKHQFGPEYNPNNKDPNGPAAPAVIPDFEGGDRIYVLGGIAAHDGMIVCSLVRQNELLIVDAKHQSIAAHLPLADPRGMAFDSQGRLLALSGKKLVRFATLSAQPETVIDAGLEDPRQLALDRDGNLLITDRGTSHQVKKFSADGQPQGTIGIAGPPAAGPYIPQHMNNPSGVAVDWQNRVWVAEADNSPRRVSLWSSAGNLLRAFYGPTEYGGGGVLDPTDPTRFYYKGMEFKLDWNQGTNELVRVFYRPGPDQPYYHGAFSPDTPLYPPQQPGRQYFTSCYTKNPAMGDHVVFIWLLVDGQARMVAALGDAQNWPKLCGEPFRAAWPAGTKPDAVYPNRNESAAFSWTDANGDGRPQRDEVKFIVQQPRGITVMKDLSIVVSRFGEQSVRFVPKFNPAGLPSYDLAQPESLGPAGGDPPSSGGDQSLADSDGWTISTIAPLPFSPFGLGGKFKGDPRWSYPSPWPGLHPSHEAAVPDRPGEVVGHTRLLGGWVQGKLGPMFCINANMGNMYLFTADGLFVSTLFNDIRLRPNWAAPVPIRNMDVSDVSLHDENFWPSITQTADGRVFLIDGARTSLVRVDGLETLSRIEPTTVTVTTADLDKARDWFAKSEAERHEKQGTGVLQVPLGGTARKVDGQLDDWPVATDWASIDRRGAKANFDSHSRPYEVSAAVALTDTHLYAAWRTSERDLLTNSGQTPLALFKHGGCLDIMLATDPTAPPDRNSPVVGDQRLLVTTVKGETRALLYRAKIPSAKDPVGFSSPWRTISFDAVDDVSSDVALATDQAGNFELSIPLAALGWKPKIGQTYRADLGVLRGSGGQTTQRVYWSNKATAITADVPSEAELTPRLWGKWKIVGP
jgi:hypothetical protein